MGLVRVKATPGRIENLRAYLYRSARNEANRFLSQRRAHPTVDADSVPLLVEAPQERVEQARDLSVALAKVPAQQREVIVLKLYHQMTFDEIAHMTGVSLNTAASRYRYGMEKARRFLLPDEEDPGEA